MSPASSTSRAAAQAPPSHRTRIVTGLRATIESLGWIAMEVGIFKRLGLECTFPRLETGGPEAVDGVVRGDWEFAETGSAPYVQAALDGEDTTVLLAAVAPLPTGMPILIRPEISDRSQLNGRRLGVLTDAGQVAISVRNIRADLNQHEHTRIALNAGARVIHLFWGDPAPYVQPVRAAGAKLLSTVASEDEAKRALDAGADILIAQGWEAGGHVRGTTSTFALVSVIVDLPKLGGLHLRTGV